MPPPGNSRKQRWNSLLQAICHEKGHILSSVTALIFPPLCLTCEELLAEDIKTQPFCSLCRSQIALITDPVCLACGVPFSGAESELRLCGECIVDPPPFTRARAMGLYKGPLLEAIHLFKFRGNMPAGERLGKMMALWANDCLTLSNYDAIFPVPLHPSKLRQRGFNQSLVLALQIAKACSIKVNASALKKIDRGAPQVGLGREERRDNVRGTFAVKNNEDLEGMKILLVDDVYTTGSTARECASTLMKEGAREVDVVALARA